MAPLHPAEVLNGRRRVGKRKTDQAGEAVVVVQAFAAARFPRGHGPMRNARAGASGWSRQAAALLPADKPAEGAMEPEQAGAVESPDSLLSNRSVRGLHGLHGLFSGCKRRGTPTRRKRVEQERPLLLSLSPLPYPLVLPPSQHPNRKGADGPPDRLSRLRR